MPMCFDPISYSWHKGILFHSHNKVNMVVKYIYSACAVIRTELTSVDDLAFELVAGPTEKQTKVPQVDTKAFTV